MSKLLELAVVVVLDWTSGFPTDAYKVLTDVTTLKTAVSGQEITILFQHGGYQESAELLIKAMKETRAITTSEIDRWSGSYGAAVPMYSRKIHLDYTDKLYYHGCWAGEPGQPGAYLSYSCTNYAIKGFRKELFTPDEISKIYAQDRPWVPLTGKEICDRLQSRVISKDNNSCTIRGFK